MMTNIPSPNTCKHKFTQIIDSIIEECQSLENPHPLKFSHELDQKYSNISVMYKELQNKNFNPQFIENFSYRNDKIVEAYLENKESELNVHADFKEFLRSSPTHKKTLKNNPSHFTFDNIKGSKVSQILHKNKRGFGKNWKDPISNTLTPESLSQSMQYSPVTKPDDCDLMSPADMFKTFQPASTSFEEDYAKSAGNNSFSYDKTLKPDPVVVNKNYMVTNEEIKLFETSTAIRNLKAKNRNLKAKYSSLGTSPINDLLVNKSFDNQFLVPKSTEKYHNQRSKTRGSEQNDKFIKKSNHFKDLNTEQASNISYRNNVLNLYITKLLERNLGIRVKNTEGKGREKKIKKKSKATQHFTEGHDNEGQYLNPEYIKYNSDVLNKLKIQRIMVAKHLKQRRATLINFPPLKKTKAIDGINEEIE